MYQATAAPTTLPSLENMHLHALRTTLTAHTAAFPLSRPLPASPTCQREAFALLHAQPADAGHAHVRVAQAGQLHQGHDLWGGAEEG